MTHADRDRSVRILTIGLDRLMAQALRADFPRATVTRVRRRGVDALPHRDPPPDLVVVDGSTTDAAAQRAAIRRRWGDDVVVAEVHGLQPIARVWRATTVVESFEIGPDCLRPFLPPQAVVERRPHSPRPLIGLRMVAYLAILWNLTVGVHVMDMPSSSVVGTMVAFAVLLISLAFRTQRSRRLGHGH